MMSQRVSGKHELEHCIPNNTIYIQLFLQIVITVEISERSNESALTIVNSAFEYTLAFAWLIELKHLPYLKILSKFPHFNSIVKLIMILVVSMILGVVGLIPINFGAHLVMIGVRALEILVSGFDCRLVKELNGEWLLTRSYALESLGLLFPHLRGVEVRIEQVRILVSSKDI